jgi:hypothetical protein
MSMPERVRVRRDHPSALSWAIALVLTMLCVYLIALGQVERAPEASIASDDGSPRVTKELSFEPLAVYSVCFGEFPTAEEARIEAARYVQRGAAGYVHEEGGVFRMLAAGYPVEADAKRVAENLSQSEDLTCTVFPRSASRVRLRITATEKQIETLTASEAELRRYAAELAEIALQLDRSEIDPDAARTLIAVTASRLDEMLRNLRAIPGASENAVCSGLFSLTEQLRASLFVLSSENSRTALSLSGKIKYNTMEATFRHIDYLTALNGL